MITLDQVQEMKPKEVIRFKIHELTEEAFDFVHDVHEINSCDCCDDLDSTYDLIWIVEDYSPLDGENPSIAFFAKWADSALCEECYLDQLNQLK